MARALVMLTQPASLLAVPLLVAAQEPRFFPAAAASNGMIYVLGGVDDTRESSARLDAYDVAAQTWSRKADMPTARDRFAAVFVDGRLLAIGGFASNTNLSVVEEYDPTLDRWSQGPALPGARHAHSAVEINSRVFVLGGYETNGSVLVSPLARMDVLEHGAREWKPQPALPHERGFFATAVLRQSIYTLGGRMRDGTAPIERFDTTTQSWEVIGQMPQPRQRFGAAVVNGTIIAVGGERTELTAVAYEPLCTGKGMP